MSHPDENRTVRRIVLPSGRSIEVIRFEEPGSERDLSHCPACHSDLVQPNSWSELQDGRWELTLECPNCWWSETGIHDQAEVAFLEDQLDQGLADMISDLQHLTQANMAGDIERFTCALEADLILPEDF